ncbi:MAG: regulatory protein RecX [Desulfobacterales bacterium]
MAPTITQLRFRRRGTEVEVHLDGQPAFSLDALRAARLRVGQVLTPDQSEALKAESDTQRAWSQALAYLGRRAYSRKEMERYLQRKGHPVPLCRRVLQRLAAENYLDDRAFAQMWVQQRLRTSPRGKLALRYELQQKGIERNLISEILAELDESEAASAAAQSRLPRFKALDERTLTLKLSRFLAGRGFRGETIAATCRRALAARSADPDDSGLPDPPPKAL